MEEGKGTVTWYFNDEILQESDKVMLTFDGTYAKLLLAQYVVQKRNFSPLSVIFALQLYYGKHGYI